MVKNLILLRGVSGSGKSTVAKLFSSGTNTVSTDDFFIDRNGNYTFNTDELVLNHEKCQATVRMMMEEEEDCIIVHNTFTEEWEMKVYIDLAKEHEYIVHTLIVENRHGSNNTHNVPDKTVEAQIKRFHVSL